MEPKIHCFSKEIFREHMTDLIALGFLGKEERNNYLPQLSMLVRPGIKSTPSPNYESGSGNITSSQK